MADPIKPLDRSNITQPHNLESSGKPVDETTKKVAAHSFLQFAHAISNAFSKLKDYIFRTDQKPPPLPPEPAEDLFSEAPEEPPEEDYPPPPPGGPPHPILLQQAGTLKRGFEIYVDGGELERVDDNFNKLDDATLQKLEELEQHEQELSNEASKKSVEEEKYRAKFDKQYSKYASDAKDAQNLINDLNAKLNAKPTLRERIANLFKFNRSD